ncbi:phosphopyruvate hydratase [Candidatus Roizmanbacteria bacterium CG_4_10_14_0_8_um_filter_35_28]|uniref:Enolase n=4 Tax=Patescibacteria group TaxID=1783273 RepID=A0A1J4T8E4_9BACT|nr:MAG: phosphopyruvate hydratase [Candidatus Falkowbacteria bacterium CG1_02_37_44]PIY71022.1 MAG: phosphopyruvate hydratase [Candidatus Roizmanbacteria bacterium CG_4_10_14_0_8_um_filter_35_28]PJC82863.1 MAG: phosphopyruvate hydratase [Candidatus Roizmanbacteria bacterium CG_4_8_14_3_um_filter_35_14]
MKIVNIKAIEILDSRGNPTLRTFITLDNGVAACSSVPSGASTGSHEAVELRDNDIKRYGGLGVLKAVNNVNSLIKNSLINQEADPKKIDETIIALDGTENKSRLGANAILSVSQALIKAAALSKKLPLWQFINEYYFNGEKPLMPKMMFNVVNGGKHANWNFDIQEFIIIPSRQLVSQSIKMASEIYHSIKKTLKEKKLSTLVGDEGGFSPALKSNEEAFQLIIDSAKQVGYENGKDFKLGIDGAASEFFQAGKYILKKDSQEITGDELIKYYLQIENKYGVYSFEDVFAEDDWENWTKFKIQLDPNKLLVGDDLFCTNTKRMKTGQEKQAANAVIIKPNQIGTIYETVEAIKLAKQYGWAVAVSHRSGETEDSFIADLAYAASADFLKTGAPCRSDRTTKYNRLIEIENSY